jgi:hypothetical protein
MEAHFRLSRWSGTLGCLSLQRTANLFALATVKATIAELCSIVELLAFVSRFRARPAVVIPGQLPEPVNTIYTLTRRTRAAASNIGEIYLASDK